MDSRMKRRTVSRMERRVESRINRAEGIEQNGNTRKRKAEASTYQPHPSEHAGRWLDVLD